MCSGPLLNMCSVKFTLFVSTLFGTSLLSKGNLCRIKSKNGQLVSEGNCNNQESVLQELDRKLAMREKETISPVELQCGSSVRYNRTLFPEKGKVTAVKCPAGCLTTPGSIWGTEVYTHGSLVCKAAIHDGKLSNAGGVTYVKLIPGQNGYSPSAAHGITSRSYGGMLPAYKFCYGMEC